MSSGFRPVAILAVSAHARSVPSSDRARVAAALREGLAGTGIVIQTCHRVEGYAAPGGDTRQLERLALPPGTRRFEAQAAVRHAMTVAVGLDSVVVGEDQVLHQVREAVDSARRAGSLDPVLERLFATALRTGRRARSWRQGPERSLATVALAEIERRSGPVAGRPLLIVGAGRMGRLAARAAGARGAAVRVASRSLAAAEALAREVDGTALPFDPGPETADVAGTIVALAGPWALAADTCAALAATPAIVDLSVPAAVPDTLAAALGDRLITADALARLDATPADDGPLTARLNALIDGATTDFLSWLEGHDRRAAAADLTRRANRAREAELEALWRRLPDADPETRAAIESMTRHFAERLLREPLERLGNDPDGSGERAVREAFAL